MSENNQSQERRNGLWSLFADALNLLKMNRPREGDSKKGMSRRDFGKFMAGAGAAMVIGPNSDFFSRFEPKLDPGEDLQSNERLNPAEITLFTDIPRGLSSEDLFNHLTQSPEFLQQVQEANLTGEERQQILDQLTEFLNPSRVNHGEMTTSSWLEVVNKLKYGDDQIQASQNEVNPRLDHGESPIQTPEISSLLDLIVNPRIWRDSDNNLHARFEVSVEKFSQMLSEHPDAKVANCSFLFGVQGVDIFNYPRNEIVPFREFVGSNELWGDNEEPYFPLYDQIAEDRFYENDQQEENYNRSPGTRPNLTRRWPSGKQEQEYGYTPDEILKLAREYAEHPKMRTVKKVESRIVEAYGPYVNTPENLQQQKENIEKLVQLCHEHPDTLIVVSAGNINSYFHEIRQTITDWPDNLLTVTYSGSARLNPADGFDISIHGELENGRLIKGSSEAAAIISGIASVLASKGLPVSEVKRAILEEFCVDKNYEGFIVPELNTKRLLYMELEEKYQEYITSTLA